jgi:tetratricopeptide (TPR) repeat protein
MPAADRQQQRQWREALTRLTRLAQRQPDAREWLEDMLRRNMPAILAPALEVAEETGDPLPEVLARALAADASLQAHETVARAVPMGATVLQDLAIASLRALLDQDTWTAGEVAVVRRHALRVALASRLAAAGRLDEARLTAEQALAGIPDDPSSRARGIDAYDVLAQCQLAAGDALGAVDSARHALALRQSIDDPYRGQAEGERRLGLALLAADRPEEACRMLVSAVSRARDQLTGARDVWFGLEDQLAAGANALHLVVTMGWDPNGFDDVAIDQGFRVDFLVGRFHGCLADLLKAVEEHGPRLSDGTFTAVRAELAATRPLLRRGVDDTVLRLRIFRLLGTGPATLVPAQPPKSADRERGRGHGDPGSGRGSQ